MEALSTIGQGALWRHAPIRRLLTIVLLSSASYSITLASIPLWQVSEGRSASLAGLPTTVMLGATIATQPIVPWLMSRLGSFAILLISLVLLGGTWPLLFTGPNLELVAVVAGARGIGFGGLTVVSGSLTATLAPRERFGECVSLMGLAVAVANLACVPAGVALVKAGGFAAVSVLGAVPLVAVPVATTLRQPRMNQVEREGRPQRRNGILRMARPALIMLVVTLTIGGVITYLPISARSGQLSTIAVFLLGTGATLAVLRSGKIIDRGYIDIILPAGLGCAMCGVVMIGIGLLLRGAPKDVAILTGTFVLGLGYGSLQTSTMVASFAGIPASSVSTASATWNFSVDIGTVIGVTIVGAIGSTAIGFIGAFFLTGALMGLTLPVAFNVKSAVSRPAEHGETSSLPTSADLLLPSSELPWDPRDG